MSKLRWDRQRHSALLAICFAVMFSFGCSARDPLHSADGSSAVSGQNLPFHSENQPASSASDSARPAIPPDPKLASGVPFRFGSRVLPPGTLVTVQLSGSLVGSKVHAGDPFSAIVAAPINVDGVTLVNRGVVAIGRIESAQSEVDRGSPMGYFQLTLNAMTIEGRPIAIRTSSLYTRGTVQPSNVSSGSNNVSGNIRVQKGRHLTFRLTAPVAFDDPGPTASREIPPSTTTE